MPSYKLHYFDSKGRAEFLRLIFAAADVKFDDNRIKNQDWPKEKPSAHTSLFEATINQNSFVRRVSLRLSLICKSVFFFHFECSDAVWANASTRGRR